jgi:hypothetical protein
MTTNTDKKPTRQLPPIEVVDDLLTMPTKVAKTCCDSERNRVRKFVGHSVHVWCRACGKVLQA